MKKCRMGRIISERRQSLPRRYLLHICVIISLLPALAVTPGCSRTPLNEEEPREEPEQPDESTAGSVRITIKPIARSTITNLLRTDLFVYPLSGSQTLEGHFTFNESSADHTLELSEGEKQIVAIVNSPYSFNDAALSKLESLEAVEFSFEDENPESPSMSGHANACIVKGSTISVGIDVTPLMCSIVLADASNNLPDYLRLEDPYIYLRNINPKAGILRENGFRPAENVEKGIPAPLPCDVGFYTQYPGTTLYCYPNETPEYTLGTPRTELVFECTIRDTLRSFPIQLPPLSRGSVHRVSLTVDESEEYSYNILE